MELTEQQAERIETLAVVNVAQQHFSQMLRNSRPPFEPGHYSHRVTLTDPRIVAELWARAMSQKVDTKDIVEDILWAAFFPGVSRNPVKLVKVCPKCGSKHILEPNRGLNLNWECFDCNAHFDTPLWVEPKHGPWLVCPICGSSSIAPPNRKHRSLYLCHHCRETFEKPVERPTRRRSRGG